MTPTTLSPEAQRRLTELAGLDPDKVTDTRAAIGVGLSLMRSDPATFKVGYTAPNALLAAMEVFPDADKAEVSRQLGIGCEVCGGEGCSAKDDSRFGHLIECRSREVVVIEDRVGNHEYGPLVEGASVLTANDEAELPGQPGTTYGLIAHVADRCPNHAIIVVTETEWCSAREWLENRLDEDAARAALEVLDR